MPRKVDKVPNPWEPYMDGSIWEFTEEEMREMPGYTPMTNSEYYVIGKRMYQWYMGKKYYVRFYDEAEMHFSSIEEMAGWNIENPGDNG